ncbi:MAG: 50S ribosomal protein L19 [Planctomycetota bacterium]
MQHPLLDAAEKSSLRADELKFAIGDTVDVHCRILEGDKERIQIFNGVVIARKHGGVRETFTVRRVVAGEGVERTFPVHSPKIAKLVVKRHGRVRRAKLFYLRDRVGKATRLRERLPKPWEVEAAEATSTKATGKKRANKKSKKKKAAE